MPSPDAAPPEPAGDAAVAAADESDSAGAAATDDRVVGEAGVARSVVRMRARGVTVLPSAEGRSLQSDPRWSSDAARRADRLLERLVARRRHLATGG